jgi:hypothetical protein
MCWENQTRPLFVNEEIHLEKIPTAAAFCIKGTPTVENYILAETVSRSDARIRGTFIP